jgi:hypothetical protein
MDRKAQELGLGQSQTRLIKAKILKLVHLMLVFSSFRSRACQH